MSYTRDGFTRIILALGLSSVPFLATGAICLIASTASAATLTYCSDGDGSVCEISNVTIDSKDYNVTFGNAPDFTLASDPAGAVTAIIDALTANACDYCVVGDNNLGDDSVAIDDTVDELLVAGPGAQAFYDGIMATEENFFPLAWSPDNISSCGSCGNPYQTYDEGNYAIYAEFSSDTAAPEPGSLAMILGGVAILALLERKRRTHRGRSVPQAR